MQAKVFKAKFIDYFKAAQLLILIYDENCILNENNQHFFSKQAN